MDRAARPDAEVGAGRWGRWGLGLCPLHDRPRDERPRAGQRRVRARGRDGRARGGGGQRQQWGRSSSGSTSRGSPAAIMLPTAAFAAAQQQQHTHAWNLHRVGKRLEGRRDGFGCMVGHEDSLLGRRLPPHCPPSFIWLFMFLLQLLLAVRTLGGLLATSVLTAGDLWAR